MFPTKYKKSGPYNHWVCVNGAWFVKVYLNKNLYKKSITKNKRRTNKKYIDHMNWRKKKINEFTSRFLKNGGDKIKKSNK